MILVIAAALMLFSVLAYVVPVLIQSFWFEGQNLKRAYNASWALVTGASTGIGKAIVERLALQGINVVLVALDDQYLKETYEELVAKFPACQFKAVGVDLSSDGQYMDELIRATNDIDISLVFNNAGYILTGLFADVELEKHLKNCQVNMLSAVRITHHFANEMINKKLKGLITFTSSSAAFLPSPMSAMYGSTKVFLTEFASSLAGELHPHGIDVLVVHPSPIQSRFYTGTGNLSMLKTFQKTAKPPSTIADCIFSCAGRCVVRDQGYFTILTKLMFKIVDWNLLTDMSRFGVQYIGDFRHMMSARPEQSCAAPK